MKKTWFVSLIMLLALAFTGVAYGGWSCMVKMNTDVKTGELRVGVRGLNVNDSGPDPLWYGGPNREGDKLGNISCKDGPYLCELDGEAYAENVEIFIRGYHSYAPGCTFEIANGGTIPAKINGVLFSWEGELARSIQVGRWSVDYHGGDRRSGSGRADLVKALGNTPLDPGQKMWVEIEFQVNQGAPDENQLASVIRNALSLVAARTAEASEDDPSAGSAGGDSGGDAPESTSPATSSGDAGAGNTETGDAAGDAPATTPPTTPSGDVGAGDTEPGDAAGDAPATTPPTTPSGDVAAGDTETGDAAGDAPVTTSPTTPSGDVGSGDTETEKPSGEQLPVLPESEPALDENPTGEAASGLGTGIIEKAGVVTGHAYGTITIIYSRWNEYDNNFSQYLNF